jgi:hypothetical protein
VVRLHLPFRDGVRTGPANCRGVDPVRHAMAKWTLQYEIHNAYESRAALVSGRAFLGQMGDDVALFG